MNTFDDTIIAPATIPGTGAICVLRVSGPDALAISSAVLGVDLSQQKGYTMKFARIYAGGVGALGAGAPAAGAQVAGGAGSASGAGGAGSASGALLDEVVASVFRAPHSYTGEDSVEISCHSSSYIVGRVLDLFVAAGARLAEAGEFTRRAFVNGKMDLTQAESVADLIASTSAAEHSVAMKQLKGGISSELDGLRADLLKVNSLLTLELDFSEEDVEFASRGELVDLCSRAIDHISGLVDSYSLGNAIKEGVPVAIAGATNAGKSSLLNALLDHDRAIVSSIEGTTRDTIEETMVVDGIKFRFIDTAGLRSEVSDEIERIGIDRSHAAIKDAAIVLCVADGTLGVDVVTEQFSAVGELVGADQKVFYIVNKCDLPGAEYKSNVPDIIRVSAKTGFGIADLKSALAAYEKDRMASSESAVLLTNKRHKVALEAARDALVRVREGLDISAPTDIVAEDLRDALYHLGTINGEITTSETLINIFSHFCIGK